MDSNKKLIVIIVTVVAVGLAVIMGVRFFTHQSRVDSASAQQAINQAKGTTMDPAKVQAIREQDRRVPMGIGRLPGNKGGQ